MVHIPAGILPDPVHTSVPAILKRLIDRLVSPAPKRGSARGVSDLPCSVLLPFVCVSHVSRQLPRLQLEGRRRRRLEGEQTPGARWPAKGRHPEGKPTIRWRDGEGCRSPPTSNYCQVEVSNTPISRKNRRFRAKKTRTEPYNLWCVRFKRRKHDPVSKRRANSFLVRTYAYV